MALYDHRCLVCEHQFETEYPMAQVGLVDIPCPRCGQPTEKVIGGTPHVRFCWMAYDAADVGSDRLALHPAKAGKLSPHSEWAGKRV